MLPLSLPLRLTWAIPSSPYLWYRVRMRSCSNPLLHGGQVTHSAVALPVCLIAALLGLAISCVAFIIAVIFFS